MFGRHLVSHIKNPKLCSDNTLHVICMISNTPRYHSRYRLYREFAEAMKDTPHVTLYTVEIAFGDREFEVTEHCNPHHLQLRTRHELWHKENAMNLGVNHLLPKNWKYLCWADTDVFWRNKNWAQEALHKLQHYNVIQPWKSCADLGMYGQSNKQFDSFAFVHNEGVPKQCHPSQPYKYAHSGYAWACTRYFWENVHGLMQFPILGSADHHMAWAMIGEVQKSIPHKIHPSYRRLCHEWEKKAFRATCGRLGFVNTHIEHHYHGPKAKRMYRERWSILIDNHYDPDHNLVCDSQGLLHIANNPKLAHEVSEYMHARSEDATE